MTRFVSESLDKHERADFVSGIDRIDRYFRETVSQDIKRSYAACDVLVERSTGKLAGFYTLSAHSIPLNDVEPELAKKLPRYPSVPAVLIGWMGRDLVFRGTGVGDRPSRRSVLPRPPVSYAREPPAQFVLADEDCLDARKGLSPHLLPLCRTTLQCWSEMRLN